MSPAHVHLCLSHAPVVITLLGVGLLVFGAWLRSEDLKKASLAFLLLAALIVVPLYLTGEPAEDSVKGLTGVSDRILDQHQSAAAIALAGTVFLGVTAAAGLIFFRRGRPMAIWFTCLALMAALIVTGLLAWTANLGGQVRHSEIRSSDAQVN